MMRGMPKKSFCRSLPITIGIAVIASLFIACPSSNGPKAAVPLASMIFTDAEISPWRSDTVAYYQGTALYNGIDGGAGQYLDQGLIKTAIQFLVDDASPSNDSLNCSAYIMDFGTSANATAMFNTIMSRAVDKKTFTSFPSTIAGFDDSPLVGIIAYAHFSRFFFQMDLKGYSDKTKAIDDAERFLTILKSKT
jgi:hypothetical protein